MSVRDCIDSDERARAVLEYRRVHSWRSVARHFAEQWSEDPRVDWRPRSNQIAGMYLVDEACKRLGAPRELTDDEI